MGVVEVRNGSGSNLKNAAIALVVPLPSIIFYLEFLQHHTCSLHPLVLANALFFLNVDLLFWLIGLLQSSHWMIDLYWTAIPVLLVHYYSTHPALRHYNWWRSRAVMLMTWVWAIRLTHNYFRRERWQWGVREDWRFSDMRRQYGRHWWWVSFFAVYVSQQVFLIGVSLPLYVVHSIDKPWNAWDSVGVAVCACGIVVAYYADTQLHNFVSRNYERRELGLPMVPNLEEGLWRYSRHPNYFGEQLWWWGLAIFGWNLGQGWTFVGALVNTMCLGYVTKLVEARMLQPEYRADAYRLYQKTTSIWIPWFRSSPLKHESKKNI
ncbi:Protein of unknown function DUF1295 [Dillenia turbinata]|uniref:Steroid 5-alpha reductase C-terminal domain-containing protein n=1 Tax=Dillenia turbinata TaxID=194707 RepID=A0AAN8UVL3_9MAGN